MIKDMFETHSEAVKELQTNVNSVIISRWFELWKQRQPDCPNVNKENLYSRHRYYTKIGYEVGKIKNESSSVKNEDILDKNSLESSNDLWTEEMLEELYKAKIFVEDRLRCVRDDYFYELLHERWLKINTNSKEKVEDVKNALLRYEGLITSASTGSDDIKVKTEVIENSEENSRNSIDSSRMNHPMILKRK